MTTFTLLTKQRTDDEKNDFLCRAPDGVHGVQQTGRAVAGRPRVEVQQQRKVQNSSVHRYTPGVRPQGGIRRCREDDEEHHRAGKT